MMPSRDRERELLADWFSSVHFDEAADWRAAEPSDDEDDEAPIVAAARPRDGDGDGFVYDDTPRMRPWNPVTDLAYPDGKVPDVVKKRQQVARQRAQAPAPRRPIERRPNQGWYDPRTAPPQVTRDAIEQAFAYDDGEYRTTVVVEALTAGRQAPTYGRSGRQLGPDALLVSGAIMRKHPRGDWPVGEYERIVDPHGAAGNFAIAEFDSLSLQPDHQGKGLGSRLFSAQVDGLRRAGIDRVEVEASSVMEEEPELNGAYTWARAGYDWKPGTRSHASVAARLRYAAEQIAAYPEVNDYGATAVTAAAEAMADRLDALRQIPDDPAKIPDDFPTPNDIATLGWEPGAESWLGRDVMLGVFGDVTWFGALDLHPDRPQLGVDDIGELPNPFATADTPGELGGAVPTKTLRGREQEDWLLRHIGHTGSESEMEDDWPEGTPLPPFTYRAVSEEDYQRSLARGFMQSDGRNNWQAQHDDPTMLDEGTVGTYYPSRGYLPEGEPGRIVKFRTEEAGFEIHPEVDDYLRRVGPIPMSAVEAVTPPIIRNRDQSLTVPVNNPFLAVDRPGETGGDATVPESPVKLTAKIDSLTPDFTPEQAEQFAAFLTGQTGMTQYASDKYLPTNVRNFAQGYSTREWLDPLFIDPDPDPNAVALVQAWRKALLDHIGEKGGDGVILHRGTVDKEIDPFVPKRTPHWSDQYNDVRPQQPDAEVIGITSWAAAKSNAKQFGGHDVTREVPVDQLIGRFGSIKGEVLVVDDPLVTRALDAWPNDVDGVPAAPFGTFPERYELAQYRDKVDAVVDDVLAAPDTDGPFQTVSDPDDPWFGRTVAYHQSPKRNRPGIAAEGLRGEFDEGEWGAVYLSPLPGSPTADGPYAEDVWQIDVTGLPVEPDDPNQMREFDDVGGSYLIPGDVPADRVRLLDSSVDAPEAPAELTYNDKPVQFAEIDASDLTSTRVLAAYTVVGDWSFPAGFVTWDRDTKQVELVGVQSNGRGRGIGAELLRRAIEMEPDLRPRENDQRSPGGEALIQRFWPGTPKATKKLTEREADARAARFLAGLGVDISDRLGTDDDIAFYEVGGAVRDDFMGIRTDDVDFAVTAPSYEAMKEQLEAQGFRIFQERPEYATIKAKVPDGHPLQERTLIADFVLARRDGPSSDGRRPDYTEPGTLEDDLARRDFTVNAIARDVDGNIIDPHGGIADIETRTLRFVGDPMARVNEDGLRVLRGFRFMVTKQLTPDPETWRALTSDTAVERLAALPDNRIAGELDKMLSYDTPGAVHLLGQLSPKMLDAIFRDGVRLTSDQKKVKGLTRDPDLPRNPFIPTDNGEAIELGSGPDGWTIVSLPPEWPPNKYEFSARFDGMDLGDGYTIANTRRSLGSAMSFKVDSDIVDRNGDVVGVVVWGFHPASGDMAELETLNVSSTHRNNGLGTRTLSAMLDAARDLGVSNVAIDAASDSREGGMIGAYVWARSGLVDWEPNDLPSRIGIAEDLRRDFPDSEEAQDIARALLSPAGREVPLPDGYPTPNDVALAGYTPGAETWPGREVLTEYGLNWWGEVNLTDPVQRTGFKAYVPPPPPPAPEVPVDRENLPPRNLDWKPPSSVALAAAFNFELPSGYRVSATPVRVTKSQVDAKILDPDGKQVGRMTWQIREASPTAYLFSISIDRSQRGNGIGGQVFAASVDNLRALGVDTIEALALSDDNHNGAYTWARAGMDWEPADWSISELGEKLNAVSWDRKGEYPEADLMTARRIGRQLAAIDELPYDPAEYPEDLPTPNDVAMIGWTPGAETWLGRDFMSGNLPPEDDPLAAVVWSGVMRVDPTPNPFATEDTPGELGSASATPYLDQLGDMTWPELTSNTFNKDEYDALSPDEQSAYFDRARTEKRGFAALVTGAISTGEITPEDAIERFGLSDDLTGDFGHGNGWQPLPPKLYHVTTAATPVRADGRLRTRTELEMQKATGLGGGTSDAISFTADRDVAEAIAASMWEASDVAAGRKTVQDMLDEAERDGFLAGFIGYWRSGWKEGDEYPPIVERMRRNLPWEYDNSVLSMVPRDSEERWSETDTPEEDRLNVYKWFSGIREYSTGRLDPLFFNSDAVAFANMPASEVAIVEVEPVPGGMGVQMGSLGEWRIPVGDAVTITDVVAPAGAPVVAAARPRDGDGDGFVYDDTPRMRPWNPVTDASYPDGVIPEKAKRVITRGKRAPFAPTDRPGGMGGDTAVVERPPTPAPQFKLHSPAAVSRVLGRTYGIEDVRIDSDKTEWEWAKGPGKWVEHRVVKVRGSHYEPDIDIEVTFDARHSGRAGVSGTVSWSVNDGDDDFGILDSTRPLDSRGDDARNVSQTIADAFTDAVSSYRRARSTGPAGKGVLTAESLIERLSGGSDQYGRVTSSDDPSRLRALRRRLAEGPAGWIETDDRLDEMSLADRQAVLRYQERFRQYGNLITLGKTPREALQEVTSKKIDVDLQPSKAPRWTDIIKGRGYLATNLWALTDPDAPAPDPDAIRFMQILREDFLAKMPETPARAVRLYRSTDHGESPFAGNDPFRFGHAGPEPVPDPTTSWMFETEAEAKIQLAGYGDELHGVDVSFDQIIGRFGGVGGEMLVVEDPKLVELIDGYLTDPRERALSILAELPDDPFATPDLRLSASERDGMAVALKEWTRNGAENVKMRFPEVSDDDARKIALLGGVPEDATDPWAFTPEWLSEVPWERVLGFAVDTTFQYRGMVDDNDADGRDSGARILTMLRDSVRTLHPSGDRTQAEPLQLLGSGEMWQDAAARSFATVARDVTVPSLQQANTELSDTDRERLRYITDAGRILLDDLRAQRGRILAEATSVPAIDRKELDDRWAAVEKADDAYTEAVAEAVELQQAHLLDWLDVADAAPVTYEWPANGERTDTWPVGPITWAEPTNLIEVKGPRFTDSRGEEYHFEPIYDGRMGDVSGFKLYKDKVEFIDNGEPAVLRNVPVRGAKPITAYSLDHDDIASIRLANLTNAVERARAADSSRRLVGSQITELQDLINAYGWEDPKTGQLSIGQAMESERNVVRQLARGAASDFLREGTRMGSGYWPEAGSDDDKKLRRILRGLVDASVMAGAPAVNERYVYPQVVVPLEAVPGFDFGWAKAELVITNPGGGVGRHTPYRLRVWIDDPTGAGDPDIVGNFDPPNGSRYVPEILQRFRGIEARYKRATEVADLQMHVAVREWAAETLDAVTPPALRDDQPEDPERVAKLMEHVTPFIPDSLKWAAGPVQVGPNPDPRSSYTAAQPNGIVVHRLNMYSKAENSVFLHEYGHHVERIGVVGKAVWAFYQHRTAGEDLIPLGDKYDPSEVTRPDDFYSRYAGKDYGKGLRRNDSGQTELLTMGLEGLFFDNEGDGGRKIDDEHAAFVLGTLLHAGERAKKYAPAAVDAGDSDGPVATFPDAKDLNDLLNERAAERPRRSRFGRVFVEGVENWGGDSNPFRPDDLIDADNPVDLGAAVEVDDPFDEVNRSRPEPPTIPDSPIAGLAATVRRSAVARLAAGEEPPEAEAIRGAIRYSQQALRDAGVETVTLYRGARVGMDPFDGASSGDFSRPVSPLALAVNGGPAGPGSITSWTTSPAKARSYASSAELTMYRAEVPVDQIVTYDIIGTAATANGWTAGSPLIGREVLVASSPEIVEEMLGERVTPATVEGNGTGIAAPAI